MEYILVTGATGFLGAAVVANLIRAGRAASLLLLVRAENAAEGVVRMAAALERLEVPAAEAEQLSPQQILIGDLGKVAGFTDDARLDRVTHVINCAAIASFSNNPLIWPVNVDGTFAFAQRMARSGRLRRFLHVGTAMACGTGNDSPVFESWELAEAEAHLVPYTASKAEIEKRIRAELPELPFVVARPSIVVGHRQLGCKPSGSIFWVFRMGHLLEQFTCELDEKIDVIPVDYCADALVTLSLKEHLTHDLYHISAGPQASCSFGEIDTALAQGLGRLPVGSRYRKVSSTGLAQLAEAFQARIGPCNKRLVLRALRLYAGFAELNYVFDNSRLQAEGVPLPPPFSGYVGLCAQTSKHTSIQEQMHWDFK
jgi:nucleoside-diphosphate-sugar epimerase